MDTVETFKSAHASVQVFTYAAHHGFNCDQRGSWHAPSAQLARDRTLDRHPLKDAHGRWIV